MYNNRSQYIVRTHVSVFMRAYVRYGVFNYISIRDCYFVAGINIWSSKYDIQRCPGDRLVSTRRETNSPLAGRRLIHLAV